ncbi:MAG: RiPP maturation radical SAM C-methyltransferase, partial [Candidatus Eremiobacteraeota bacterium]|nr:RiPP maturation radical SAM C-methyltransferase [Candidatus Eremiobacteraeota bacterium]
MPFAATEHPSLGLSLLKSALTAAGIGSTVEYLNLSFAQLLGYGSYDSICKTRETDLIGEWVFAAELDSESQANDHTFTQRYLAPHGAAFAAEVRSARGLAASFLETATARILAHSPSVVGFTSVFQQHVASLALARMLKARAPHLKILFGGANCEGVMGATLVESFPWIDAVVSGEADHIIVDLMQKLLAAESIDARPGVFTRSAPDVVQAEGYAGEPPAMLAMDSLPYPDFADFFDQFAAHDVPAPWKPRLLFETARGCWWGAKQHCTFCGLNGTTMAFRSKSPERAIAELECLVNTYGTKSIGAVDNIMDMRYLANFVPELARRNLELDLLYEVKANLKKEQLRALKAAGIHTIQPGIESLSTPVLALMRKGVRALQNVQLLKWCQELDIAVSWNMLWGFPGENPLEYPAMAKLVSKLVHLRPPDASGRIRLDRFSPNFDNAESIGLTRVDPHESYRCVYQLDDDATRGLAYYFTFEYADARDVAAYTLPLSEALSVWNEVHKTSRLIAVDYGEALLIADWRTNRTSSFAVLEGLERALYLRCD